MLKQINNNCLLWPNPTITLPNVTTSMLEIVNKFEYLSCLPDKGLADLKKHFKKNLEIPKKVFVVVVVTHFDLIQIIIFVAKSSQIINNKIFIKNKLILQMY